MKHTIKRIANFFNYQIEKTLPPFDEVQFAVNIMLSLKNAVTIVQVGANDGLVGDPIHTAAHLFRERTKILLIEPQKYLISILAETYRGHPGAHVYNGAIGSEKELTLYAIRPECWEEFRVPYAKGWPTYRAPTGVTSTSRSHVEKWARTYYKGTKNLNEVIRSSTVRSAPLIQVLAESNFGTDVDILQIDTEGFDDEVIYNSSIENLQPKIIRFESHALPKAKLDKLEAFLSEMGYLIYRRSFDIVAVCSNLYLHRCVESARGT